LAKIISAAISGPRHVDHLTLSQRELKKGQADSLFRILKVDSAFYYTQQQFNFLQQKGCSWSKDGKIYDNKISDGGVVYLTQFSKGKILTLQQYAPKYYLEHCAPFVSEFKILKGLVNTDDKLTEAVIHKL
jgi:hypothetical protein